MRACVQYGLNFESNSGANTLRAWFRQLAAVEASSILPGLPNQSTQLVPGSVHGGEIGPEDLLERRDTGFAGLERAAGPVWFVPAAPSGCEQQLGEADVPHARRR